MKTLIIIAFCTLCAFNSVAKDKITLNQGKRIKGTITHIEEDRVVITKGKKEYEFNSDQVRYIEFDAQNVKISKIIQENVTEFSYLDGQNDAAQYHKRFGGNFALGVAFGLFGFIGVAVGNVKDPSPLIPEYEDKINSADYREGYRKKGKGKNLGAAGAGWAVGFVIILIIAAAAS